jgi:hypothetical protein
MNSNQVSSKKLAPSILLSVIAAATVLVPLSARSQYILLGNDLVQRQYPSDGAGDVFEVYTGEPVAENGFIVGVETYRQSGASLSVFNAYLLRPTGNAGEYNVIFDSGPLDLTGKPLDSVAVFSFDPVAVKAGDLIAHYGGGMSADIPGESPDNTYWKLGAGITPQPTAASTIILGSVDYPFYQLRTYSLAAEFTTVPEPQTYAAVFGMGILLFAAVRSGRLRHT